MAAYIKDNKPIDWSMTTDEEGHRDYSVLWEVFTDGATYGPDDAMFCPGLPMPGASLNIGHCVDPWAFYQRKGSAKLKERGKHRSVWIVETAFSTRPVRRCQTDKMEDPLLEPHRVRGGFDTFQREPICDNSGDAILNSAGQRFRGPTVQIEDGWPTVEVEQNASWINLPFLAQYRYSVNNAVWWGCPIRTIKCKTFTWERVLYGLCYFYFRVTTSFQLNEETWDLHLLDEGDMVKVPNSSPVRYKRAQDEYENLVHVLLDGHGEALPAGAAEVYLDKRVLAELDFSVVGWPAALL